MEALIAFIVIIGVVLLLLVYNSLSWGFVLYKFWPWFVLPIFPDLPHLGFLQAVGLSLFIGLFHNQVLPQVKKEYREDSGWQIYLGPWLTLLFGWVVYGIFF